MKKKIIIIISSILAAILLTVSIVLVVTLRRPTPDGPTTDDGPDVKVEEATVLVEQKKDLKTRFVVGDNMPDLTTYFDVYEDLNPIEVKQEYILSELDMTKSGAYKVTCSYKDISDSVTIYVDDVYEITVSVESVDVTVGQTDVDYKQYFQLTKNGQTMEVTDDMLSISVDVSKEGIGIVNCIYLNQSKSIKVVVKEEKVPDTPTPGPETPPVDPSNPSNPTEPTEPVDPVEGVRLVVSTDLTFPVGTNVSLKDLCELYDGETKIENTELKFNTDLNVYMAGSYDVFTSVLYDFKEYTFDKFTITISPSEEVVLKEQDIEKLKTSVLADEQNVYSKYIVSADLTVKKNYKVGNVMVDYYYPTDLGIMFYYDSEKTNDVITLSYLLQYYYANSTLINLPKLYVLDINKELAKLESAEQSEDNLKLKSVLTKIKNEEYTSLIETKSPGKTAKDGDLWAQGKYYHKYYENNKVIIDVLKEANNTYDLRTYSNYLDTYFNKK